MNAAGMLGYAPDLRRYPQIAQLGCFITNPVSRLPRSEAESRTATRFAGGALVHSGLPNPGLPAVIRQHARSWRQSPLPVLLHLMVEHVTGLSECLRLLDGVEGLTGLELSFHPGITTDEILACARLSTREWPVVIELDIHQPDQTLAGLVSCDVAAVCSAPVRGVMPDGSTGDGQTLAGGRVYGPGVFPQSMYWLRSARCYGLPVIAAGGIFSLREAELCIQAGAIAVKLDTVLWSGGINFPAGWSPGRH